MNVYSLICHLQNTPRKRKAFVGDGTDGTPEGSIQREKRRKVHGKKSTVAASLGIASQVVFLLFLSCCLVRDISLLVIMVLQSAEEDRIIVAATEGETSLRIGRVLLEKDGKRIKKSRSSYNRKKRSDVEKPDAENISRCASIHCKEAETELPMLNCDFCEEWFHGL